ncbi:golgin subfamily A member 4-like isoform X1 [Frieseomelitta varia]|uniref:golgin subfamily A member 4-like isoform X1 n=1 Tax=Frieseomelitta varia TaxID=561572 RepID=UPI001CB68AE6|nr:golgin subfamily A member 4-like isoform X1 [Frieseomelitta varia]XP_043512268.1 golgin subfamily A member 4-like isoform X1 [Frieseomelitta varia]XP_043512269.1 golgin subfamily A member 4-like isoform X1 [Frieseomelitta varia]
MSNKTNSAKKIVSTRSNKNTVETNHHLPDTEIIVKIKRPSTMVSSIPTSHKSIEEKKRPSNSDTYQNWSRLFREQNKAVIKPTVSLSGSKSSKHDSETKETKKHFSNHQKLDHKFLDEIPVKQTSQKRVEEHVKSTPHTTNPSTISIPSTVESVVVYDKGIQCDGIYDYSDDKFGVFNPVRTLNFLIKELVHLVKDDKANEILANMEQALVRISMEPNRSPIVQDLEAKLERTKQINSIYETIREERDSLLRQVHEQRLLLSNVQERQLDLETTEKTQKQELEKAIKTIQARDKTITELTEKMNGYESSQKIVAELRMNLAEQTEHVRRLNSEMQHLRLEKEKLSVLSSYKDSLLTEHRNTIKELQCVADQLSNLKDIREESLNPQMSFVHEQRLCSSRTSTSSHDSNIHTSWHDVPDISLSTVDHDASKLKNVQDFLHKSNKIPVFSKIQDENLGNKQIKNIKESSTKDLEFISLPAGESSLTLLPSYKDLGCTEINKSVDQEKDDALMFSNKRTDNLHNFKDTNKISSEHLNLSIEKNTIKELARMTKSVESDKKQSLPDNIIDCNITEQFQNIVQDIRMQSRIPVNVPSPLRSYPHPEWSDSTLPSISTASDSEYREM